MRSETRSDSRLFSNLMRSLLKDGISIRFRAHGRSMFPAIHEDDVLQIDPVDSIQRGDVVMVETTDGLRVHRVVETESAIVTRGDCAFESEPVDRLFGKASIVVGERTNSVKRQRLSSTVRRWIARFRGQF